MMVAGESYQIFEEVIPILHKIYQKIGGILPSSFYETKDITVKKILILNKILINPIYQHIKRITRDSQMGIIISEMQGWYNPKLINGIYLFID